MVDTDSESSHRALFVETNAASDLPERTLYRVVTLSTTYYTVLRYVALTRPLRTSRLAL